MLCDAHVRALGTPGLVCAARPPMVHEGLTENGGAMAGFAVQNSEPRTLILWCTTIQAHQQRCHQSGRYTGPACALTENGCWARGATRAGMCHKAGRPSPTNGHLRCGGALPSMKFSLSPCLGVSLLAPVGGIHDPCGASVSGCHL